MNLAVAKRSFYFTGATIYELYELWIKLEVLKSGENARFDARKGLRSNLKIDECLFLNVTSMYLISRVSNIKVILHT